MVEGPVMGERCSGHGSQEARSKKRARGMYSFRSQPQRATSSNQGPLPCSMSLMNTCVDQSTDEQSTLMFQTLSKHICTGETAQIQLRRVDIMNSREKGSIQSYSCTCEWNCQP